MEGTWTVTIIDSSFLQNLQLTDATLIFNFMETLPSFPKKNPCRTSPSVYPKDSSDSKLVLLPKSDTVQCGVEFTGEIKMNGIQDKEQTSLFIEDRNSGRTLTLDFVIHNETFAALVPCMYEGNRTFYFVAQNRPENTFTYKQNHCCSSEYDRIYIH